MQTGNSVPCGTFRAVFDIQNGNDIQSGYTFWVKNADFMVIFRIVYAIMIIFSNFAPGNQ